MAILSMFYGLIISMFYMDNRQHKVPHIHVSYQGDFNSVHPFVGTIQWSNEADLCPDTVYLDSIKI